MANATIVIGHYIGGSLTQSTLINKNKQLRYAVIVCWKIAYGENINYENKNE